MNGRIISFRDLEVYQKTYKACIEVMTRIIPAIPEYERNDLKSQLRRSVKAIPRLIAEGYAKRHQKHGFQKYLNDAMGERNETIVGLEQCKDLYGEEVDEKLCEQLIDVYESRAGNYTNCRLFGLILRDDRRNLSLMKRAS